MPGEPGPVGPPGPPGNSPIEPVGLRGYVVSVTPADQLVCQPTLTLFYLLSVCLFDFTEP